MPQNKLKSFINIIKKLVSTTNEYLSEPATSQEAVLIQLLKYYSNNDYGRKHGSEKIGSYEEYKKAFPIKTYDDYKPLIDRVLEGDISALLSEEPIAWQTTRGTTTGTPKYIPLTPEDVERIKVGARVSGSYFVQNKDFSLLTGKILNLSNRSNLKTIKMGDKELNLGYGASIKAKLLKTIDMPYPLVPTQEEIDELGGGSSKEDWEARHELVYQKAKNLSVRSVSATAKSTILFGQYLLEKHNVYPKDLWNIKIMVLASSPGINTRLAGTLHDMYGEKTNIREMYGATEGIFGGQLDEKKAWSPFYDNLFFEVKTIDTIKPLYEMTPGEIGSLIVSTPVFPRYRIGDLILAFEPPYFRCIGRENHVLEPYCFEEL